MAKMDYDVIRLILSYKWLICSGNSLLGYVKIIDERLSPPNMVGISPPIDPTIFYFWMVV